MLRPLVVVFVLLSALCGLAYPLLVTGIAAAVLPQQAHGSLLRRDGRLVGSLLIGQPTTDPALFWGRPSATDGNGSGGANLGPTNPALVDAVRSRVAALRQADPGITLPVPADLVTTSASGLDPHISVAAALVQVPRVARARGLAPARLQQLVARQAEGRRFGFLGEPRVNVLALNLALPPQPGR